ncbi:glycosyltransferase [Rhodobacterales bacterium HKCCA1058]|nr:glycosyltransferase [Rhodobacterales bacterium HKCCA1058]
MKKYLSIITICKNDKVGLHASCSSIYAQNLSGVEHIIIDGGSTDGTEDVLIKFSELGSHYVSGCDNGIYDAMNKGIKMASGKFICFLNSGDVFSGPDVVKELVSRLQGFNANNPTAIYGNVSFHDSNGLRLRYWCPGHFYRYKYYLGWMTPHPSTIIPKAYFENFGMFDQKYKISGDYDLMFRFFFKFQAPAEYVDIDVVDMQVGGVSNKSFFNICVANVEVLICWYKYGYIPPLWIFFLKPISKAFQFRQIRNVWYNLLP